MDTNAKKEKFECESTGNAVAGMIRAFQLSEEDSEKYERKTIEKWFPNWSWDEYAAKIAETEAQFPRPPEIVHSDPQRQAEFESMWYISQKTEASKKRWSELMAELQKIDGGPLSPDGHGFEVYYRGKRME
ncbi:uncharacterized protein LOC129576320 [Sitodiplosis mosellana]|uniref:uncharacterized protein LOC129576320 n=1 Tax=Sitodiplosis mosellana TaxID=263140 RepID=UPI002443C1D8|nr:uncharacterized protein LOC129576320 [Sitodiplosis mosellana]